MSEGGREGALRCVWPPNRALLPRTAYITTIIE